jgi:hypothetical protein
MRTTPWLLLTLTLLASAPSVVSAEDRAASQIQANGEDELTLGLFGVTAGVYVGFEATLMGLGIDHAIHGHRFDLGWAIFETAWGAANAAGSITLLQTFAGPSDVDGLVLGAGLGIGAVGIFHIAHGLSSLFQAGGASEPKPLDHQEGTSISVDPLQGGAMVTVTGSMPG